MASVTYGKCIMANVIMAKIIMAKILWQMKLSLTKVNQYTLIHSVGVNKVGYWGHKHPRLVT